MQTHDGKESLKARKLLSLHIGRRLKSFKIKVTSPKVYWVQNGDPFKNNLNMSKLSVTGTNFTKLKIFGKERNHFKM